MNKILLNDILKISKEDIKKYKIKFNINNGYEEPLVVMSESRKKYVIGLDGKNLKTIYQDRE